MTLREAFETHYLKDELKRNTVRRYRHLLTVWETLTADPPIECIDDVTMERFRQAALDAGYSGESIKSCWQTYRAILRRVGPRETRNPAGLNIIERVPYMRPVKIRRKLPKRVPLESLSKLYVAFRHASDPRPGVSHPSDWWRAWLVFSYVTGFRRCDVFAIEWDVIDLDDGLIEFSSEKTWRADLFPLHPVAVEHLKRLRDAKGGRVFKAAYRSRSGSFYRMLHQFQDRAGVEHFCPHDIRRTGGSEVERVRPGLGRVFLQHSPRDVSDTFYLNRSEELREAIESMRLPAGFSGGVKVYAKRQEQERQKRVEMRQPELVAPEGPNPADWQFRAGQFAYRGQWYPMSGRRLRVLKALVSSPDPVGWRELVPIIYGPGKSPNAIDTSEDRTIHVTISQVRGRLRDCFGLEGFDPVPCTERGDGGAWTVQLPPEINRDVRGGAA